jgi:hypothetical protein
MGKLIEDLMKTKVLVAHLSKRDARNIMGTKATFE